MVTRLLLAATAIIGLVRFLWPAPPAPARWDASLIVVVFSLSAATPGSTLPSRYSSDAPAPVETCDTLLATPA